MTPIVCDECGGFHDLYLEPHESTIVESRIVGPFEQLQQVVTDLQQRLELAEKQIADLKDALRWKQAIDDALVCCEMVASDDPVESLNRLICWHNKVAIDPNVSKEAATLRDTSLLGELADWLKQNTHPRDWCEVVPATKYAE